MQKRNVDKQKSYVVLLLPCDNCENNLANVILKSNIFAFKTRKTLENVSVTQTT